MAKLDSTLVYGDLNVTKDLSIKGVATIDGSENGGGYSLGVGVDTIGSIIADGNIFTYTESQAGVSMKAPIFYDSDNTGYYVNPAGTSNINELNVAAKRTDFSASSGWDAVGFGNATNLHMNGHNQFWIGAGNGTWFTGAANTKSQASGLAADATSTHDLLITTMQGTSTTDRGITFAVDSNGAGTAGWRLGKFHSGTDATDSMFAVDGQIRAKGGYADEYDYYADDYSSYYNDGQAHWSGDTNAGWHKPSIVASSAIQIQSGNKATNARKPQIQFHQYGYGGPAIEYDGPNKKLQIGMIGTSTASRFNTFSLKFGSNEAFVVNADYASHNSDMRAPLFYDSDNTSFYVDAASTTQLNHLSVNSTLHSRNFAGGSMGYQLENRNADGVTFRYDGETFKFYGGAGVGTVFEMNEDGNSTGTTSLRAPIFYDSNDTNYYLDPSTINTSLNANGSIKGDYFVGSKSASKGYTVYKGYDNFNHFISIRGYAQPGQGKTDAAITGQHITSFVEYTTNSSTGWFFMGSSGTNYEQIAKITKDHSVFLGSARAPIFYDSNNTTYYLNPAGDSILNKTRFINNTLPFIIKVNSGYRSWGHHVSASDDYVIVPSATDGAEDFSWNDGVNFSKTGTVTANNFILRSDERLKTKITDLPCDNIDVSWKSYELKSSEGDKRVGVIAQELEQKHPEFVNTDKKGFKSVKYIDLLIAKIAELEARLEKLEK